MVISSQKTTTLLRNQFTNLSGCEGLSEIWSAIFHFNDEFQIYIYIYIASLSSFSHEIRATEVSQYPIWYPNDFRHRAAHLSGIYLDPLTSLQDRFVAGKRHLDSSGRVSGKLETCKMCKILLMATGQTNTNMENIGKLNLDQMTPRKVSPYFLDG